MTINIIASATNNADWKTIFEVSDGETEDPIDFTGTYVEVEIKDQNGCKVIEASTTNGKITLLEPGSFEMFIPAAEMSKLCPGVYQAGGLCNAEGTIISLFVASLTVIDGVARA